MLVLYGPDNIIGSIYSSAINEPDMFSHLLLNYNRVLPIVITHTITKHHPIGNRNNNFCNIGKFNNMIQVGQVSRLNIVEDPSLYHEGERQLK